MKKTLLSQFFIAALHLLSAGCVSAPRLTSKELTWAPPEDALKPDKVWSSIREQNYDFSKPMTLAQIADIAIQNNPALSRAWNEAMASAAQVEQARGYLMPAITGVMSGKQFKTSSDPGRYDSDYNQYGAGLQLNYLVLSFGGGLVAAVEQALQTVYAANFNFNKTLQDVLLAVENAYYAVISALGVVDAAEASVKNFMKTLDAAEQRRSQKIGTTLDVLQARAGYDEARYNLASALGQVKIAVGTLALAMGVPSDIEIKLVPPSADIPASVSNQDMRALIDEALSRRPDIEVLRASLAAKEAAVKVSGSALWPSLYLNGSVFRNYYNGTTANPMQDQDMSYTGGISLQWNLFDGLSTLSARRSAEALAESARASLKQAELAASVDVWSCYQNYETALEKYKFSDAFLKSAKASYEMALESYNAGLKSMLDVLDSESKLTQARTLNVAARQEVFTALASLAYATGKDLRKQ